MPQIRLCTLQIQLVRHNYRRLIDGALKNRVLYIFQRNLAADAHDGIVDIILAQQLFNITHAATKEPAHKNNPKCRTSMPPIDVNSSAGFSPVSYTHLRAHE